MKLMLVICQVEHKFMLFFFFLRSCTFKRNQLTSACWVFVSVKKKKKDYRMVSVPCALRPLVPGLVCPNVVGKQFVNSPFSIHTSSVKAPTTNEVKARPQTNRGGGKMPKPSTRVGLFSFSFPPLFFSTFASITPIFRLQPTDPGHAVSANIYCQL